MEDTDRLVAKCFAAVAITLALMIPGCVMHANQKVENMVANGANPIAAKCAVWGEGDGICQSYILKGGNNGQ